MIPEAKAEGPQRKKKKEENLQPNQMFAHSIYVINRNTKDPMQYNCQCIQ
jgi:hypothetical protein